MALPLDYVKLLYVVCNGNQYIDTSINLKDYSYFKLTFSLYATYNNWNGLFTNTSNNSRGGGYLTNNNNGFYFKYNNVSISDSNKIVGRHTLDFEFDNGRINQYLDGVQCLDSKTAAQITVDDFLRIGRNWNSSFHGNIYKVIFNDGTNNLLELQPCVDNNGVVGLYDEVNNQFYASRNNAFEPGIEYVEASININTTGTGTAEVEQQTTYLVGESYQFVAQPGNNYAFAGWFDEFSNALISLNRIADITIPRAEFNLTALFIEKVYTTNTITKRFKLYRTTGNTLTRRDSDVYLQDIEIKIPLVYQSFKDAPGAFYNSNGVCNGFALNNQTGSEGFNSYIADIDSLTTLIDVNYINRFYANKPYTITNSPNTKGYNFILVDESTGNYITLGAAVTSNYGVGYFYDKDNTQLKSVRGLFNRDQYNSPVMYTTIGFTGIYDGQTITEDTKFILVQAQGTGASKRLIIQSTQEGDLYGDANILKWFAAAGEEFKPERYTPYTPSTPLDELPSDVIDNSLGTGYMAYGDTDMFTIFTPTEAQVKELARQAYGGDLFSWLQGIGLSIEGVNDDIMNFYVIPTTVNSSGVKYISGNRIPVNTSVQMNYTNTNYIEIDCGSIYVEPLYNNFLDYKMQVGIYLPFINYQPLDTEDVVGKTLKVVYRIDLLTGDAVAQILVNGSTLYQFTGNAAYGLPAAAEHFSDIIQKGLTAASMINVGAAAMKEGQTQILQAEHNFETGKLDETEFGRAVGYGEQRVKEGRAMKQHAVGDLGNIQFGGAKRSGAISGNTGMLTINKPYLILKRPRIEIPARFEEYNGYPCNKYLNLGDVGGYTEVEDIHITNINATQSEIDEIEKLLKGGVIL